MNNLTRIIRLTLLTLLAPITQGQAVPVILTQPEQQTNYSGAAITFAVVADDSLPLTYQWQKNQTNVDDGDRISGATTDTLSLSAVSPADAGAYSVLVSNSVGGVSSSNAELVVYALLIQNGGFEIGGLVPWAKSGNTAGFSVRSSAAYVHSGSRGARVGPIGNLGYLSQGVPTLPGQAYLISCWLSLEDGGSGVTPNQFSVLWNGSSIYSQTNGGATGWTNLQFVVTATDTNALLSFGFQNDPTYFGFDDVSVLPMPAFQSVSKLGDSLAFNWQALAGFRYQIQSSTSLPQPVWTDLGNIFFSESDTTATGLDPIASGPPQKFYRVRVLP